MSQPRIAASVAALARRSAATQGLLLDEDLSRRSAGERMRSLRHSITVYDGSEDHRQQQACSKRRQERSWRPPETRSTPAGTRRAVGAIAGSAIAGRGRSDATNSSMRSLPVAARITSRGGPVSVGSRSGPRRQAPARRRPGAIRGREPGVSSAARPCLGSDATTHARGLGAGACCWGSWVASSDRAPRRSICSGEREPPLLALLRTGV